MLQYHAECTRDILIFFDAVNFKQWETQWVVHVVHLNYICSSHTTPETSARIEVQVQIILPSIYSMSNFSITLILVHVRALCETWYMGIETAAMTCNVNTQSESDTAHNLT